LSAASPSVLVVEDHPAMGELLGRFLVERGQAAIWAIVPSAEEALERLAAVVSQDGASQGLPDILLVDVSLPGMNGIALVGEVGRLYPGLPCLMVSAHRDVNYVRQALGNGARGYVAKGYPQAILKAINIVLRGEIYLSERMRNALGW
jgi:DNA-binding NarL/FixJ family response regulator